MSDLYTYDYSNPKYDEQRNQWYWEGRRSDTGKKVRKYDKIEGQGQATQYETNQYAQAGYQYASQHATGSIEAGMQAMNLHQQPVDPYGTIAPNYTTLQTGAQTQGLPTYTGDSTPADYQTRPRTLPVSPNYQLPSASDSEQRPQPPATAQGTANVDVQDRANYANPGQFEIAGAGYGAGGDTDFQRSDKGKSRSAAMPHPGQQSSLLQGSYGGSYEYDGYYGPSHYGQSPTNAIDDGHSVDRSRKHKHKGKGRAGAESRSHDPRDKQRAFDYGGSQQDAYSLGGGQDLRRPSGTLGAAAGSRHGQGAASVSGSGSGHPAFQGSPNSVGGPGDDDDEEALRAGIEASRNLYDYGGAGEMSTRGGPVYEVASGDVPPPTSYHTSSKSSSTRISGTKGQCEALDKRYRVEPSSRFEPGEVFKVMWHEPKGAPIGGGSVITEFVALQDHMDEVWTGFRRFIIIANDEGHCTCVPILTYGNQGCRKAGVKPSKHGIVYEQGTAPATLQHEPKLGFDPVRMQMTANNEHISGQSRVNYSKLVTVEHNVKVFFIGRILLDDWDIVRNAVDECWTAKTRDKSHHSNRRSKR